MPLELVAETVEAEVDIAALHEVMARLLMIHLRRRQDGGGAAS